MAPRLGKLPVEGQKKPDLRPLDPGFGELRHWLESAPRRTRSLAQPRMSEPGNALGVTAHTVDHSR
jgi:hypothetical protein